MSARWQLPLFVSAWCAAFVVGSFGSVAWAQCNHGGGLNPRMSQGLIAQQQMLQQQQLMQQQQQLLQTAKLDRQMRELAKEGPEAIKTTLKDPNAEMRLIAVLTVAKYGPALTDDLIERLTDDNASVRQAARRGLISLSTQHDGKPGKARSVDFGPTTTANRSLQESAARKWRTWFERLQKRKEDLKAVAVKPAAPLVVAKQDAPVAPVAAVASEESGLLTKQLVEATPAQSDEVVSKLRDGKGAVYTQALADAIPQMSGLARDKAREALAERLTRMTAATLRDKLSDENPEVRRAAALACAMKESTSHVPDLIVLLEDPAPAVPPAARAALKSLTNQDFGAISRSDAVQQQRVVASWKAWWQKQGGS